MFREQVLRLYTPGEVKLVAVGGQAGAGKTNHVAPLMEQILQEGDIPVYQLSLDAFFILSSEDRKTWLEEGYRISAEEGARRADQMLWWDFEKAQRAFDTLRQGNELVLNNIYNRADKGRLTGSLTIQPDWRGGVVLVEGVALLHLNGLAERWFVHAPAAVRFARLRQRDKHRQGQEVVDRFRITQAFEVPYFQQYWERIDRLVDNSVDDPAFSPMLSCDRALSEEGLTQVMQNVA